MRRLLLLGGVLLAMLAPSKIDPAQAQFAPRRVPGAAVPTPVNRTDPVAFTADEVQYDRDNALVTASGKVEAWQNDHVLRADKIVFDRNTNVAAATGNVVIVEPDGQVLFSDYAELTEGMRDGVLSGMRAILAENGRLVANGARRTDGKINELSRAVYSTCNLCAEDPSKPPLWQLRARSAVQDNENKKIEYRDAVLDIYGIPVAYFPYFWHVDPSQRRASGFLVPSFGQSKHLGAFLSTPYFWAIDEVSDATLVPNLNTKNGFNLTTEYRRRFNDGTLTVDAGVGLDSGKLEADIFARGRFTLDETWRYGFDINRATSSQYLRDYRIQHRADVLTSRFYLEGFGTGAYTKLDSVAYQGLVSSITQAKLPFVLPRYEYSYFGEPDRLGGRLSFDTTNFNVLRQTGTSTQRAAASLNWQRPFTGAFGEVYGLTLRADAAGYSAQSLNQNPNFSTNNNALLGQARPQAALEVRWPFVRDAGSLGTQLIEPIAQVITAPSVNVNRYRKVPNEDSLDIDFTDQNLFSLNRFPGTDRVEGGLRANVGMHLNWTAGSTVLDGLVGQSFRTSKDNLFPIGSGLENKSSDIIARATISPVSWFDVTGRTRVSPRNYNIHFADVLGSAGTDRFRVTAGYIYNEVNPYFQYDQATIPASYYLHRNEITVGASSRIGRFSVSGYARRDLNLGKMTSAGVRGTYEDECFIFDVNFNKRYTSLNGDTGATLILFQITLKTVGQFGYHAS